MVQAKITFHTLRFEQHQSHPSPPGEDISFTMNYCIILYRYHVENGLYTVAALILSFRSLVN